MLKRGLSYIELTTTVFVAGIVMCVALPDGNASGAEQGSAFARRFAADVAYARSLSIARPEDPAILRIDGDSQSYWIARQSAPDTPLTVPGTDKPYRVKVGPGGDLGCEKIELVACNFGGGGTLELKPTGETALDVDAVLQFTACGVPMQVTLSEATGAIRTTNGHTADAQSLTSQEVDDSQFGGKGGDEPADQLEAVGIGGW